MANLKTQNPVDVAIAEAGQLAKGLGSMQWLLEKRTCPDAPEITQGNQLDFYICGENGFREISRSLSEAKSTVDIICWGFDPGMELVRSGDKWPRGQTYGELLEQLAQRGVKVRLLLWYDSLASKKQDNMPGYTDGAAGLSAPPYDDDSRASYCNLWWIKHFQAEENSNIQIVLRDVAKDDVKALIQADIKEEDMPQSDWYNPVDEASLLYSWPTHHQKPILIDYGYEGGSYAVGYVMGLNSVTDFWDTAEHPIDTGLREKATKKTLSNEIGHEYVSDFGPDEISHGESDSIRKIHGGRYQSIKPYQDYACRIQGPALKRLHENFENGWNASAPSHSRPAPVGAVPAAKMPSDSAYQVQIVRTQAHEREKTIKKLYFQATSVARNYIYIENQYFFYPEFARHLKEERKKFCDAWARLAKKPLLQVPTLHLFIVIPHPEDDGMVPRTFDTLTELGRSDTMPGQAGYVDAGVVDQQYGANARQGTYYTETWNRRTGQVRVPHTHQVLDRPSIQDLEKTLGLKVSVARLCTSGPVNGKMAYREIYIHSKLMMIDDVFLTLGSANLNQRSMSVDSEINIAATGPDWVTGLRREVFNMHSGDTVDGQGGREGMPDVFKRWNALADANYQKWKAGQANLTGHLVKFEDMRKTSTMHASITLPSSGNSTALA